MRDARLRSTHLTWTDTPDLDSYQEALTAAARDVADRGFDLAEVMRFLIARVELKNDYERDEKARLARDIEQDLNLLAWFASVGLGVEWEQLLACVRTEHGEYRRQQVALLDPLELTRRNAIRSVGYLKESYEKGLPPGLAQPLPATLSEELVAFCDSKGLYEALTALGGYSFSTEDLEQDRLPGFLWRRLRSLAIATEQVTKVILEGHVSTTRLTLTPTIETLGRTTNEPWQNYVSTHKFMTAESVTNSFLQQVTNIEALRSPTDGVPEIVGRTFLLACLARNATVHSPRAWDSGAEREALGILSVACGQAIIQAWWIGRQRGWL